MNNEIADEIMEMVSIHHPQGLFGHQVLPQLKHFGSDLLAGVIACLDDSRPEVRLVAVEILGELRPDSDIALPLIFKRLADEDRLVRVTTLRRLEDEFGPFPVEALPHLESWLDCKDDYERILAANAILRHDPNRTELLPMIRAGLFIRHPGVWELTSKFFGLPFDAEPPFDDLMP